MLVPDTEQHRVEGQIKEPEGEVRNEQPSDERHRNHHDLVVDLVPINRQNSSNANKRMEGILTEIAARLQTFAAKMNYNTVISLAQPKNKWNFALK